jgi:hypothetical protein
MDMNRLFFSHRLHWRFVSVLKWRFRTVHVGSVRRQWFNGKGEGQQVTCPRVPWVHGSRLGSILIVSFRLFWTQVCDESRFQVVGRHRNLFLGFLAARPGPCLEEKRDTRACAFPLFFHPDVSDGMKRQTRGKACWRTSFCVNSMTDLEICT